ncbi:MAG: DUF3316 domain-containing protein [Prevotellaceae bacterium]|nr:DUF3316 domain-containing protein [Prevotellaceae bacterium]
MNIRKLLILILLLPLTGLQAQETARYGRESSTMFGVSNVNQWDTYLSNERYHGGGITALSQISRPTHWFDRRLYVQHITQGNLALAEPRSDKHKSISGFFHWQVAWQYQFLNDDNEQATKTNRWSGAAGIGLQTRLGFVYNTLGGNNPASARAALNIIASGQVRRHFALWQKPFVATLQADVPLTGAFFTPDYGQSYYEIFSLGHYSRNVRAVNPFKAFQTNLLLTLDYRLKHNTALRVGCQGQYMQSDANGLKTQDFCHSILVGFVRNL